jgi:DNA-binding MurR/RpiR family transcriptional regulator
MLLIWELVIFLETHRANYSMILKFDPHMLYSMFRITKGRARLKTAGNNQAFSFESRIRRHHSEFPPSFQRLGDFLLDSYPQAALMTATELAHTLDLDPGTVVRFAQKLDYPGYPELQRDLRRKLKEELLHVPSLSAENQGNQADIAFSAASRCLELARRSFPIPASDQLINMLDICERVLLIAEEIALPAAQNLYYWLTAAGYTIQLAVDSPVRIARLLTGAHPQDMVLAIEISPDSPFLLRALTKANETGLKTAAVTSSPSSKLTHIATTALVGHANPEPALRQFMVESMIHVFIQVLRQARPLRFHNSSEEALRITNQLISDET